MNEEILIFDRSKEAGEALAREIRSAYKRLSGAVFTVRDPEEVFTGPMPEKPFAAFFVFGGMYDAEAARKFHAIWSGVPVVVVSEGGEGAEDAVMAFPLGACDYLVRPITAEKLKEAVKRCANHQAHVGCIHPG